VFEDAPVVHVQHLAWHTDQRHFVSCASDIRLWDAETGTRVRLLAGHDDTIRSVVWSRDGRRLVSASHDRTVRIWEADSGRCLQVLQGEDACLVNALWTADETAVLACDSDGHLFAWSLSTPQ
jgi:WD40 repeat protein